MFPSRTPAAVLAILAAIALTSCGSGWVTEAPRPDKAGSQGAHPAMASPSADQLSGVAVPEHLRIPAIGVSTAVIRLGLNPNRTVEVPRHADEAGWFELGPAPGQLGSAVLLGHVDSRRGAAVFYRLSELRRGNRIQVRLSDGAVADFAVVRVATYPNREFPARRVYAGNPRHRALTLVTCGGAYDPDAGGYQSNVVVYTSFLRTRAHR